jgi:stringent starvation protein B
MPESSTKPYLIRAIYEWCTDNGYRPYIAVAVDERTQVPMEFVRNGEIVLNVSPDATQRLKMGNELIEFEARFNRVARAVSVPIENVTAVYAAENGHGMAFDVPKAPAHPEPRPVASSSSSSSPQAAGGEEPRAPVQLAAVDGGGGAAHAAAAPGPAPGSGSASGPAGAPLVGTESPEGPQPPAPGGRPKLTRVK